MAELIGCTTAQLALAWVLRNDNVAVGDRGSQSARSRSPTTSGALDVELSDELASRIEGLVASSTVTDPAMTEAFAPSERP